MVSGRLRIQSRDFGLPLTLYFKLDQRALAGKGSMGSQKAGHISELQATVCQGTEGHWMQQGSFAVIFLSA